MSRNKRTSRKVAEHKIAGSGCWVVKRGRLVPGRGRPANVIQNKRHEREVETMLIRAASPLLVFNDRKRRPTIEVGNVLDYETGTMFYERQSKRRKKGGG